MLRDGDFERLSMAHLERFREMARMHPPRHSESVFTTLVSWNHYVNIYLLGLGDCIVLKQVLDGETRLRMPVGGYSRDVMESIFAYCKEKCDDPVLVGIDERSMELLKADFPDLRFHPNRDFFDYIYRTRRLADLEGKDFLKIRNTINRFKRTYAYTTEPVTRANMPEIDEFLKRWCLWKDCSQHPVLEKEREAIIFSMRHFFDLGLEGMALRIDGEIEALSIWEEICPDTAMVHYEKGVADFAGIYQVINNETAKLLSPRYEFLNRESDMGVEGLRRAKMRYRPDRMLPVHYLLKGEM